MQHAQVSLKSKKRPRPPQILSGLPLSSLGVASSGQSQSIELSEESVGDLTRAYVLCESALKCLHDAIESAKIKERKSQRIDNPISGESYTAAIDGSDYGP